MNIHLLQKPKLSFIKGKFWTKTILMLLFFMLLSITKVQAQSPNLAWAKQMGGTGIDVSKSIAVDAVGNVYTTGYFQGTADFDPSAGVYNLTSAGSTDVFVTKLDATGNLVWAKAMGSTVSDIGQGISTDAAGNVYINGYFQGTADFDPNAGIFNLTSAGVQDIFVTKLDVAGNLVWAKAMGGTASDFGNGISTDAAGNVYTTGYFAGTVDFDPNAGVSNLTSAGVQDIFVSKLDTTGNLVWAKAMGGIASDAGYGITTDAAGNVYTTGYFTGTVDFDPNAGVSSLTSAGGQDIFVSKLDATGNLVWAKAMGGINTDIGYGISSDAAGNVYTTGYFTGTVDFDPNAGVSSLTSAGGQDIFVSKLDATGNLVWAKAMGGTSSDIGYGISTDAVGNVYTTGYFQGTVDFDPNAGVSNLTSAGFADVFVTKLDATGNLVWAKAMGSTVSDIGFGISTDAVGNVYTTGYFSGTTDFDPNVGVYSLTPAGSQDIFVHKMGAIQGAALNFDGVNDQVVLPSSLPATDDLTYEAWIYPKNLTGFRSILNHTVWTTGSIHFQLLEGVLHFDFNGKNYTAGFDFEINNWYHVAAVYSKSSASITFYVNGNLINTVAVSNPVTIPAGMAIEMGGWANSRFFDGQIDEVRIWNRALTQCEIQNNMDGELSTGQSGLVAYYKFNQGAASEINTDINELTDSSGNSNTGMLINFELSGTTSNWVSTGAITTGSTSSAFSLLSVVTHQTFCESATVAGLIATGTGIKWYDVSTDGIALTTSTSLATGTYYVTQTTSTCESPRTEVAVTVTTAPVINNLVPGGRTLCEKTSPTLATINAFVTGSDLKWYADATGGTPLDLSVAIAPVSTNLSYYVSQTENGCESARLKYDAFVNPSPLPIAVDQSFCARTTPTVANLVATANGGGSNIKWYLSETDVDPLPSASVLTERDYYVAQTAYPCGEGLRKKITVTIKDTEETSVNACRSYTWPLDGKTYTESSNPSFDDGCITHYLNLSIVPLPKVFSQLKPDGSTIADIAIVQGESVQWYADAIGGEPLSTTTLLETKNYYVSQTKTFTDTNSQCESDRLAVNIIVGAMPAGFTFIPDPRFEQKLIDLGYDDVIDNKVLTVNIANVTSLYLIGVGIHDLTGIKGFTRLERLTIDNNPIAALDLSGNASLTQINANGNHMTTLNVTGLTRLEFLDCSDNPITELDLNGTTNMQVLMCSVTKISALNVSKMPNLYSLTCFRIPTLSCITVNDIDKANDNSRIGNWDKDNSAVYSLGTTSTTTESACDNYTWSANGKNYTSSGTYTYAIGCDTQVLNLTINKTPVLDTPVNVGACGSYTLPALTVGNYFSEPNGGGVALFAGEVFTSGSRTIYVYAESSTTPNCTAENSFSVSIIPLPIVDAPADVTACGSYTLPTPTNGDFYSAPNGIGYLEPGTVITETQTIYVWAETRQNPNCTNENSFAVTIKPLPAIVMPSNLYTYCTGLIIENIYGRSETVHYYDAQNGNSEIDKTAPLIAGTYFVSQTINGCEGPRSEVQVAIAQRPAAPVINPISLCGNTTIADLEAEYPNTQWITELGADALSSDVALLFGTNTYYVNTYDNNCESDYVPVSITIHPVAVADAPENNTVCGSYRLPALTVGNYFTGANGGGTALFAGDVITSSQKIYVYAESGTIPNCTNENSFILTVLPTSSNTTTISACDSYTWPVNGTAYTAGGNYSVVTGCHTEILALTITPSTSNTTTASACDSYTWSVNGTAYTASGNYSVVTGCHTENLALTITPSTANTTTISVCDSYIWSVNGIAYTASGNYSVVTGCHTENLALTITPSTSNTTTASACDSYTWSVNGTAYTASGNYSVVTGCHTENLALTITPSTANTTTISVYDSYIWSVNGTAYTASGNYSVVTGCHTENLALTITPQIPITVTATASQSKIYGENNPVYTYTVSPSLVSGDSFTGALTRVAGENIGNYTINVGTLSAGNKYLMTYVSKDFTITAKPITVTADASQTKVYGAVDPTFTYAVSPSLVGSDTFAGALTRATGENAGTYAITQGSLSAGSNYTITYVSKDFSIAAKPITVTATASQAKVYGTVDPVFAYTVSPSLVGSDTFTGALTRVTGENIGTYAITQGSLSAGSNYAITYVSKDFVITAKPITVTATALQTKVYGASNPVFAYTVSPSLVSGDSFTGSLTRVTGENVGTYAITQGSLSAGSNYTITYASKDFTITAKSITVTANASQTKVYGTVNPTLTYSFLPSLVSGDSFTGSLTRVTGENVGTYAIAQGSLSAGSNYSITYIGDNFIITKADQTITWGQTLGQGCDGETTVILTATSSSGLPVSYSSSNSNIATISNGLLVVKNYGSATITASQGGNNNYNAAPVVVLPVVISQPNLIRKHFEDIIFFDNSSESFKSYSWYKNGVLVPSQTAQYFKESGALNGTYYVVATKLDGTLINTCPLILSPTVEEEYIKIVPNPVKTNSSYELITNVSSSRLQNAHIEVYSVGGLLIENKTTSENTVTLKAPMAEGIYIVKMTLANGKYFTKNLLVKN
ncbi:T9SS type A sorting domain-containing protein [Flavobacterium gawalongense]|uniref:T9SS type A sorting domain-containing protein n=1 Tax=Flavobacterium gawalongense TaxID=2594432 RepID=A0ABY3CKS3_9FLAO|nr:MBG domain-containing protein [Flavobacterium gawalongense]TRX04688.1 T9SS type A sorting domain-containing protein [Flavobacterium gawalongense]